MSPNLLGALLMMGSMAAFTFNDAAIKLVGADLPLFQLLVLRGIMSSVLLAGLGWWLGALRFRIAGRDARMIALRAAAEAGAAYFFLTALINMPLANVTAILQVLPLTVTLGAALVFREQVGWRRMLAILFGFAGMLLIVRPGPEGFNEYAIYALVAVGCVTLRDLATRRLSPEVPSLTVTLISALAVLGFASVMSTGSAWQPVSAQSWTLIVVASFLITGAYFLSVQVMRVGEVGFVAPFRYTGLLWALVLGWLIFGDWPDPVTLLGAAVVVAAGLFTLYRERAALRRGG